MNGGVSHAFEIRHHLLREIAAQFGEILRLLTGRAERDAPFQNVEERAIVEMLRGARNSAFP